MLSHLSTFEDWLASYPNAPLKRFHPIPPAIRPFFEKQLNAFNRRKTYIQSLVAPSRSIEIYTDFADEPGCDAFASIYHYLGLIALTKGGTMLPIEMFSNMLSHPLIMVGLGRPNLERAGPRHREGLLDDYDRLIAKRQKAGQSLQPIFPRCRVRIETAFMCAEIIWSFLMLHELIHLLHGHIDYLYHTRRSCRKIDAFHANSTRFVSPYDLDLQALELWADNKAIAVSLGGMLSDQWNSDLAMHFPTPSHKVFIWCFAMYTLFRIWGLKTDAANLAGDHPPQVVRFQTAMIIASLTAVAKCAGFTEDEFIAAMHAGTREAEKAIAYCGGDRLRPEDVVSIRDQRVIKHREMLVDHFDNVLANELPNYSYVSLDDQAA